MKKTNRTRMHILYWIYSIRILKGMAGNSKLESVCKSMILLLEKEVGGVGGGEMHFLVLTQQECELTGKHSR